MKTDKMYKFTDDEGCTVISVNRPAGECEECFQIVADRKKVITSDGEKFHYSLIVKDPSSYYEVDDPNPPDFGEEDLEELESEEE